MWIVIASPVPQAVADRAQAEFDAVLSQERELDAEALVATLRSSAARGVLVSSRQKLDATTIAFPALASSSRRRYTVSFAATSIPRVGSSNRSTVQSRASQRAITTFC